MIKIYTKDGTRELQPQEIEAIDKKFYNFNELQKKKFVIQKYRFLVNLDNAGLCDQFINFLKQDSKTMFYWDAAIEIDQDNQMFINGVKQFQLLNNLSESSVVKIIMNSRK